VPEFDITIARPWHCGQLARRLRHEHHRVLCSIGRGCHAEIRQSFDESSYRRAWCIDGKVSALFGMTGQALSTRALVWMAVSNEATRYPIALVRDSRAALSDMAILKHHLFCSILDADVTSQRFAIFLGFVPATAKRMDAAFSKIWRKELFRRLHDSDEIVMPAGNGCARLMVYQGA
jgi:hypothetical protein